MGSLPDGWTSLEPHVRGVLAVAISANLSLVTISALVSFIGLLLWRFYSTGNEIERQERRTKNKAIRFLASTHGLLFMDLLLGDLLQAIGFVLNYSWYHHRGLPPTSNPNALCTTQAVLIQVGDLASAFSSLFITLNLFSVIVFSRHPSSKALCCVIVLQWIVVGILAGIGPRWLEHAGMPFYADAGSWCWISAHYVDARLWLHYFFVFLIAFVDLVLYSIIALYLTLQSKRTAAKIPLNISNLSGVSKIMFLYSISYIVTILPLSSYRAASMAGHPWGLDAQLACGFIFTLSGFVNCTIYATTRNIISSESVGAIRRGSRQSGTISGYAQGRRKGRIRNFFFSHRPNWSAVSRDSNSLQGKSSGVGGGTGTDATNHHLSSSAGIRVQVETEVHHLGVNVSPVPTPLSLFEEEEGDGRGGTRATSSSRGGRLEYERERIRDWQREKEMEFDRRQREGEHPQDRPFASLREIELEETSSARRSSGESTTRKDSSDYV